MHPNFLKDTECVKNHSKYRVQSRIHAFRSHVPTKFLYNGVASSVERAAINPRIDERVPLTFRRSYTACVTKRLCPELSNPFRRISSAKSHLHRPDRGADRPNVAFVGK